MKISPYFLLFLGVFALPAPPAHAAQDIRFDAPFSEISRKSIDQYFQSTGAGSGSFAVAPVDLNEDGLQEFIVRDKTCDSSQQSCNFKILAESEDKITLLGEIPAYRLALGNSYTQGVRSLLAFENAVNDYDYAVYVWEPQQARYMMEKQK